MHEAYLQGCRALADGNWKDAAARFSEMVARADVHTAPAYIGLLCARLKVNSAHDISDFSGSADAIVEPLSATDEFQRALQATINLFTTNEEYKRLLLHYQGLWNEVEDMKRYERRRIAREAKERQMQLDAEAKEAEEKSRILKAEAAYRENERRMQPYFDRYRRFEHRIARHEGTYAIVTDKGSVEMCTCNWISESSSKRDGKYQVKRKNLHWKNIVSVYIWGSTVLGVTASGAVESNRDLSFVASLSDVKQLLPLDDALAVLKRDGSVTVFYGKGKKHDLEWEEVGRIVSLSRKELVGIGLNGKLLKDFLKVDPYNTIAQYRYRPITINSSTGFPTVIESVWWTSSSSNKELRFLCSDGNIYDSCGHCLSLQGYLVCVGSNYLLLGNGEMHKSLRQNYSAMPLFPDATTVAMDVVAASDGAILTMSGEIIVDSKVDQLRKVTLGWKGVACHDTMPSAVPSNAWLKDDIKSRMMTCPLADHLMRMADASTGGYPYDASSFNKMVLQEFGVPSGKELKEWYTAIGGDWNEPEFYVKAKFFEINPKKIISSFAQFGKEYAPSILTDEYERYRMVREWTTGDGYFSYTKADGTTEELRIKGQRNA